MLSTAGDADTTSRLVYVCRVCSVRAARSDCAETYTFATDKLLDEHALRSHLVGRC